ncbi:MAG TPA: hypothetical protein VOA41_08795 [Candidatus Dormibacteraeota bacterium]|nr:hypothetical protein [Candidatus Dormibacteraeota bacterium]
MREIEVKQSFDRNSVAAASVPPMEADLCVDFAWQAVHNPRAFAAHQDLAKGESMSDVEVVPQLKPSLGNEDMAQRPVRQDPHRLPREVCRWRWNGRR